MMVHVTEEAQAQIGKFFKENEDLQQSVRVYLQLGG